MLLYGNNKWLTVNTQSNGVLREVKTKTICKPCECVDTVKRVSLEKSVEVLTSEKKIKFFLFCPEFKGIFSDTKRNLRKRNLFVSAISMKSVLLVFWSNTLEVKHREQGKIKEFPGGASIPTISGHSCPRQLCPRLVRAHSRHHSYENSWPRARPVQHRVRSEQQPVPWRNEHGISTRVAGEAEGQVSVVCLNNLFWAVAIWVDREVQRHQMNETWYIFNENIILYCIIV